MRFQKVGSPDIKFPAVRLRLSFNRPGLALTMIRPNLSCYFQHAPCDLTLACHKVMIDHVSQDDHIRHGPLERPDILRAHVQS